MKSYMQVILDEMNYGGLPLRYWPQTESTGSTAVDLMTLARGSGSDGAYVGAFSLNQTPGATSRGRDGAAQFSTPDGFQNVSVSMPATSHSLEAWVKTTTVSSTRSGIFGSNQQFCVSFNSDSGRGENSNGLLYGYRFGSGNRPVAFWSGWNGAAGWHHVAAVFDSGTMRLYFDGVERATTTATISAWTLTRVGGAWGGTEYNSGDRPLRGQMEHTAIYNYALSPDRIAAHYLIGVNGVPGR